MFNKDSKLQIVEALLDLAYSKLCLTVRKLQVSDCISNAGQEIMSKFTGIRSLSDTQQGNR